MAKSNLLIALLVAVAAGLPIRAEVIVQSEQVNPADPAWKLQKIPRPSKSDVAAGARVTVAGHQFEAAAADGSVLVNGVLPIDSLDLTEEALLTSANPKAGHLVLDLGKVQEIAAVGTYSWHEWDVDGGSRAPQVYTLYGSAADKPDPADPGQWKKLTSVDTRPNPAGENWNGQHGVLIRDSSGPLGQFRYLLFVIEPTRSPRQSNPGLTHTLFSEIDVHTAKTLAQAGDAEIAKPADVDHVWVVFKTHLDIGYTDRIEDVLKKYREEMMEGALKVIEASRDLPKEQRFSWTLAGWPLMHVLGPEQDPARRDRIETAVREGAIAFHALPFTTHTETHDLEDLVRSLGYSTRLAKRFNKPLPIGAKMTDVPSHSWVLPTVLAHAGVKFLQLGCNDNSAYVHVPRLFWWEGPDGSRILCNYTRVYGSGFVPPRDWPSRNYLAMVMTYDNVGPPSAQDVERMRAEAQRKLPGAKIHFGTLDDFARAVIAENPELPVVRADMPDTWIHGWMSMPMEARAVRRSRPLAPALELLDTQLRLWDLAPETLAEDLGAAYENSALFTEHTFGPWGPKGGPWETGIPRRNLYGEEWKTAYASGAYKKYEQGFDDKRAFAWNAARLVNRELEARLRLLANGVGADPDHVVIYNALPWKRSGVVEIPGKPGQYLYAEEVPAGGYRTYPKRRNDGVKAKQPTPNSLETTHYTVQFDLARGGISSLVERASGREMVDQSSPYALGQFLHERFDYAQMVDFFVAYDRPPVPGQGAWGAFVKQDFPTNVQYAALTPKQWKLSVHSAAAADVVTLSAGDTLGLAQGITMVFTFFRHEPSLDVEWRVASKTPDPMPEGGWICFPLAVRDPQFKLGRLGGPIDPTRDIVKGGNRHYFCLNSGLTIYGSDAPGFGLVPLDSPCVSLDEPGLWKFSLDYTPKRPSVFVNLYNNEWNTNFPEWQSGSWTSRVRLWPLKGKRDFAQDLVTPAWEARVPLLAVVADAPKRSLPRTAVGLGLSRKGVLVTAFGQNPEGQGTVLRLWEQAGQNGLCKVRLPDSLQARTAQPVTLRGEPIGAPVPIKAKQFPVELKPFAPQSFILMP